MATDDDGQPEPRHPEDRAGRRSLPDLGRRGGGWVALQAVLFVAAAGIGWYGARWPDASRLGLAIAAAVAFFAGIAMLLAGGAGLGRQLTPFPRPVASGELRQDGIYGRVRHPIYGGVLLLLLAWALASSPWALIAVAAATAFFDAKRRREERWLEEQHTDLSLIHI